MWYFPRKKLTRCIIFGDADFTMRNCFSGFDVVLGCGGSTAMTELTVRNNAPPEGGVLFVPDDLGRGGCRNLHRGAAAHYRRVSNSVFLASNSASLRIFRPRSSASLSIIANTSSSAVLAMVSRWGRRAAPALARPARRRFPFPPCVARHRSRRWAGAPRRSGRTGC